jgi:iron-sulfur cluster assembly protein
MLAPKAGVKVFVGSKALLHVIGTEMDYVEDDLQSGFVFNNPQAKSTCGCGESFTL